MVSPKKRLHEGGHVWRRQVALIINGLVRYSEFRFGNGSANFSQTRKYLPVWTNSPASVCAGKVTVLRGLNTAYGDAPGRQFGAFEPKRTGKIRGRLLEPMAPGRGANLLLGA